MWILGSSVKVCVHTYISVFVCEMAWVRICANTNQTHVTKIRLQLAVNGFVQLYTHTYYWTGKHPNFCCKSQSTNNKSQSLPTFVYNNLRKRKQEKAKCNVCTFNVLIKDRIENRRILLLFFYFDYNRNGTKHSCTFISSIQLCWCQPITQLLLSDGAQWKTFLRLVDRNVNWENIKTNKTKFYWEKRAVKLCH